MGRKLTLAGIVGTAAAAAAIAFTGGNEGLRNNPYRDTGGVWTVCRGQTGVPMRYYTDGECDAMLAGQLAEDAGKISAMTPGFDALPDDVKVATIDFVYNVGVGAYERSTLRQKLIRKQLPQACDEFLKWRYVGSTDCATPENKRVCGGVWTRRQEERKMCRGEYAKH